MGLETAKTAFQQVEELTSYRFDRHGERGRSALFSLAAIDAEFVGIGTTWVEIAADLQQQGYLHPETAQKIPKAYLFGRYIANIDMHLGNLSLRPTDYGFTLVPLYDMTPMAFATPTVTTLPQSMHNQVLESKWFTEQESKQVHELTHTFWQCLAENELISEDFKGICQQVLLHVFS